MNKVHILHIFMYLALSMMLDVRGSDFLKQFVKSDPNQKYFIGFIEEKQQLLDELKKEQGERAESDKTLSTKLVEQLEENQAMLVKVDNDLKGNSEDEQLLKVQTLLKESEQVI